MLPAVKKSRIDLPRRRFIALGASAILVPRGVVAQNAIKRVGVLGVAGGGVYTEWKELFPREFAALGWVDGKNLQLAWYDVAFAGDATNAQLRERGRKRAAEMAADHLDCMVANGEPHARFLQEASRTIPIVVNVPDPIGLGFAQTLSHPGGNMTGLHEGTEEVALKTVEMFRRLVPKLSCVAWIGAENFRKSHGGAIEAAARAANLGFREIVLRRDEPAEAARVTGGMARFSREGCRAAVAFPIGDETDRAVIAAAMQHKLVLAGLPRDGFVFTYGALRSTAQDTAKRVPAMVARILRGERPGDIPFEGPTAYEFFLNLRTAARIGLDVPKDVLVFADRVRR